MPSSSGIPRILPVFHAKKHEVQRCNSRNSWKIGCSRQRLSPALIANTLRTSKSEIASTLGPGRDAFSRKSRIGARKSQVRLRQMLEILNRVEAETGSPLAAYAWFRGQPLPSFGGATPDQLVREGKAEHVHAYLDRIMAGGYA